MATDNKVRLPRVRAVRLASATLHAERTRRPPPQPQQGVGERTRFDGDSGEFLDTF